MSDESGSQKPVAKQTRKKKDDGQLSLIAGAILVLFLGGMCFFPAMNAMQIVDDIRLHSTGVIAKDGICYSHHKTRGGGDVHVVYTAPDGPKGTVYAKDVYLLAFPLFHSDEECVVRYDPKRPTHVSTSWGMASLSFG